MVGCGRGASESEPEDESESDSELESDEELDSDLAGRGERDLPSSKSRTCIFGANLIDLRAFSAFGLGTRLLSELGLALGSEKLELPSLDANIGSLAGSSSLALLLDCSGFGL